MTDKYKERKHSLSTDPALWGAAGAATGDHTPAHSCLALLLEHSHREGLCRPLYQCPSPLCLGIGFANKYVCVKGMPCLKLSQNWGASGVLTEPNGIRWNPYRTSAIRDPRITLDMALSTSRGDSSWEAAEFRDEFELCTTFIF